jgi:HlyD family secretion protein
VKRLTKILISLGGVLVVGGGAALAIGGVGGGLGKGKGADDVIKVERGDLSVTVAETGIVQPITKVEVKSRIAGQASKVFVDVGDRVSKGQPVIQLDTTDLERNVAQSRADVEMATARLARLRAGARPEEREASRAEELQAEADFRRAQADYKRVGAAKAFGSLTDREVEQVRAEYESSKARLAAARSRRRLVLAGSRSEDIAEAAAQLSRAQVSLQAAQDQLSYATIRSPMNGVVITRHIEAGEFVSPGVSALAQGGAILTIADLAKLIINTNLNQVDVGKVKKGLPVDVRVDSAPGRTFKGHVRKVAPAAEAQKDQGNNIQTFLVETLVGEGEADATILRPGMTADLDIQVTTKKAILLLPVESIVRGKGDEATVTLPAAKKDAKPETRPIKLGMSNDHKVEIVSGLKEGEKVLIKPASSADNAMKF